MALPRTKNDASRYDFERNYMGSASAQTLTVLPYPTPSLYEFDSYIQTSVEYEQFTNDIDIAVFSWTGKISTEKTTVELDIKQHFLEMMTRRRGYSSIAEYITALIDQDDEAMWDEQFAALSDELLPFEIEALAESDEELDEDSDTDLDD